jgi:hypothetical protein
MPVTNAQWRAIVRAAAPRVPSTRAREAVEACLRDYRGLQIDRAALRKNRKRQQHIAKLASQLANQLRESEEDRADDVKVVQIIQIRAETLVKGFAIQAPFMRGRRDPAREWFYENILEIWTDEFGGKRTAAKTGPLIRFMRAVAQHVIKPLPKPSTFRDAVLRKQGRKRRRADRPLSLAKIILKR